MAAALLTGGGHYGFYAVKMYRAHSVPQMSGNIDLNDYQPFSDHNLLATLDQPATLQIPLGQRPRLDGAIALYPLYAAFVQAAYPPPEDEYKMEYSPYSSDVVAMNNTPEAYWRLIEGKTDIIFVTNPSDEQVKAAAAVGKTFTLTPIGKEAFVFFVHRNNPVNNLTTEQVVKIYSGSQSTLQKIMGNTPLMSPPREDRLASMGGIVNVVADYRNYENALGFSFRYYTQTMLKNNQIKLLDINGIAPTRENIANDSYPYTRRFYAVTTGSESPAAKQFIEWIQSQQGQELVEKTGYVGLGK